MKYLSEGKGNMKILVVSEEFSRGGLETQIKTYYENLPEDVEMIFAFQRYTESVILENAKIYTGFHFSFNDTIKDFCEDVERLIDIIKTEKIDVIHAHPFYSFFAPLFASQITKTKLIYSYHGFGSFNFLNTPVIASVFKYAFEVGAVAQLHTVSIVGKQCFEAIGYKNNVLLPNPVDLKRFQTAKYINNKKWALISRIDMDKIIEIKSLLLSKKEYGIDSIDVYGSGTEVEDLENFISENNLSDSVQFKGYCNDLYNTLNEKYNGIIGIGRVVIEGLAMGMPVFLIGYGKLTGFINKELYDQISLLNFINNKINDVNYNLPSDDDIIAIQNDIRKKLSIDEIIKTYINSIKNSDSIYMYNLSRLYLELKKLSENPDFSNCLFVNSRIVYDLLRNYIQRYSVDNDLNNMFIVTDYMHYKLDDLIYNNIQNLLSEQRNEMAQIKTINNELQDRLFYLQEQIEVLKQKEAYRFNREQAAFDRRSRKLYVRIGRKIKKFFKIGGKQQ